MGRSSVFFKGFLRVASTPTHGKCNIAREEKNDRDQGWGGAVFSSRAFSRVASTPTHGKCNLAREEKNDRDHGWGGAVAGGILR